MLLLARADVVAVSPRIVIVEDGAPIPLTEVNRPRRAARRS
jgi:hypothetical protein